jgi:hypothetical protein
VDRSLWVVSSDDPTCSVLLATSGDEAAAELERRVTHRPGGGPVGQRGAVLGCGCDLVLADAASPQVRPASPASWPLPHARPAISAAASALLQCQPSTDAGAAGAA